MGEKIPRRQGRRRHRVLEGKIGKVSAYGSVERDPSLVRKQSDRRCRERLRAGPEREERVGRYRQVLVHIAVTEAASEDEVSPLDDSHGHARNLVTCHETADKGREIVGKSGPVSRSGLEPERRQANGHEERRQDRPSLPQCYGALQDFLGNQKETAGQENHHAREKDEPHEQADAQVQSDRRDAPRLPGAAWPDEKRVADLHHQRAPACEHRDPGIPRQPAEIESAEDGLRDRLPDGLAVPPLSPHGFVQTGGEIDHAKVDLHHPQTTDGNRFLSAGGGRTRRERPGAPGRKEKEIEEERIGQLIHTIKRSKTARHEAEVKAPRQKRRESGVKSQSEREQASGIAREQKDNGGVRTDPEGQKGLGQGWEAGHPGIAQQVRELPGNDSPTAMK